ncbi:MAG: hypothetical protein ACUVX8_11075 [Candidatus Zipacnadales bacterium]
MLKAGWANIDITPPVGIDLSGFGGRAGPNVGVHDCLAAKALYMTDGERAWVLVTADLVGLDAATVAKIRQGIEERLGGNELPVMVACSHTHSGPATPCLPFLGRPDADYLEELIRRLVGVALAATEQRYAVGVGYGRAPVEVGVNRRERNAEGRIILGRNAGGPTAPYVDVVRVQGDQGCAVLFSHAAHPVTLGGDNLWITADWPGYAQRISEERLGCLALYGQGCCGDINCRLRGSFEAAEEQGKQVAEAVVQAAMTLSLTQEAEVGAKSITLELPLEDPPPVTEAQAILERAEREREAHSEMDNYGMRLVREGMVEWARRLLALSEAGVRGLTQAFEIQGLRVGEIAIVGLLGEVFVDYQHQIRESSPFAHTIVLAYTNGNIGYVPTREAFSQGGYEVETAIKYYGTTMLTPECERLVVEGAGQVLRELR